MSTGAMVHQGNVQGGNVCRDNFLYYLIDKSVHNFRPRKFEQRTSDSLSLNVDRYLIFARRTAFSNVVGANRPGANRPKCKPILVRESSNIWAKRPATLKPNSSQVRS